MRLPGSQSLEAAHTAVVKESRFGGLLAPDVRRGGRFSDKVSQN